MEKMAPPNKKRVLCGVRNDFAKKREKRFGGNAFAFLQLFARFLTFFLEIRAA
jgi:hypothetical protein